MITIFTTATTAITPTVAVSLSLAVVLFLMGLLIQKEIFSSLQGTRAKMISNTLNVVLAPLLIAFACTVFFKMYDLLR